MPALGEALSNAKARDGRSLAELSDAGPVLLVAVRHTGCTFCRAELADLAAKRDELVAAGVTPAVLTMGGSADIAPLMARTGLGDVPAFSDPDRRVYRALGLGRGGWGELFGPRVWRRGAATFFAGHGIGKMVGDGFQMPGAFLIHRGEILAAHRHADASDAADVCGLIRTA